MSNNRQLLGRSGEDTVARYLQKKGYKILVQNYRCQLGEIDIIARDGDVLVFIEVKTRSGCTFGSPAAAVTPRKQRQISKAAQWYLTEERRFDTPARFDVVAVSSAPGTDHRIEHISNAFDLCE